MPSRPTSAPPPTCRRHRTGAGVSRSSIKDLRLRRVIPPASALLDSSPDRAAVKLGSVQSTPPETSAMAAGDWERRPMLAPCSRSKLVHDTGSFGYRRLLPFLTEMAMDDKSNAKNDPIAAGIEETEKRKLLLPDEASTDDASLLPLTDPRRREDQPEIVVTDMARAQEANGFNRSGFGLVKCSVVAQPPSAGTGSCTNGVDEFVDGGHAEAGPVMKIEDQETKEEISLASDDISKSKPSLARCSRSRLVRHPSSFSYKRLLPFLMEIAKDENSPQEDNTAENESIVEERKPLTSDGDDVLAEGPFQLSVTEEPLNVQPQECFDFVKTQPCQSSESEHSDVDSGSPPEKKVMPLPNLCDTQELQTSIVKPEASYNDDPLLDAEMMCRPSDPCAINMSLSMEEMAGCVPQIASGSGKVCEVRMSRARGALSFEKKALSPRKGILKKHTRGCKGICMCLDCTTFRLHADRAFEFSRKQMQEADDIIIHLLKEMASLRHLIEKSSSPTFINGRSCAALQQNQQESMRIACERASRVEDVVKERCQQMFLDLNSHCRIPGPRVKFLQYIEEKTVPSPSPEHGNRR